MSNKKETKCINFSPGAKFKETYAKTCNLGISKKVKVYLSTEIIAYLLVYAAFNFQGKKGLVF